jgi:hypothetical protein
MFETYRMLGREHEADLAREADSYRRGETFRHRHRRVVRAAVAAAAVAVAFVFVWLFV